MNRVGALVWAAVAALTGGCTTTFITLDAAVDANGRDPKSLDPRGVDAGTEVSSPAKGLDAAVDTLSPSASPDAMAPDPLPTTPSFAEAKAAGSPLTDVGGFYVELTCCKNDGVSLPADCVTRELGSPVSCQDYAHWKWAASVVCDSLGALLTNYAVYGACSYLDVTSLEKATTTARFGFAKCCVGGTSSAGCFDQIVGRSDLCLEVGRLTELAKNRCDEAGGVVDTLAFYGPC